MYSEQHSDQEENRFAFPPANKKENSNVPMTQEQLLSKAKELFHVDLTDTEKVLALIGKLSLSEKTTDKEHGLHLAELNETFLKAKKSSEPHTEDDIQALEKHYKLAA